MAEPDKQHIGDGSDNYGQAASQSTKAIGQAANAAKNVGKEVASQVTQKGFEAAANAAAASVQAGVQTGTAVAEVAAGTAAGGPWGAIIAAAWAMRHTLFKILVALCLFLLVLVILIASLPGVLWDSFWGFNTEPSSEGYTITEVAEMLSDSVAVVVEDGYDSSMAEAERRINEGGYDYEVSMEALINYAQESQGYDVAYILAAYSVSVNPTDTTKNDMLTKLRNVSEEMFPVSSEEKEKEITTTETDEETGETVTTTEVVTYLECTIHPFNHSVIHTAFSIDPNAAYNEFGTTYGEVITNMSLILKRTVYGTAIAGGSVPLTDAEMIDFVNRQECSEIRRQLVKTGLSLVGKVPYFWGGKSAAGWNEKWNTPQLVTAAGSPTTGSIRPFGLDCSGFSDWVYKTALGKSIGAGTSGQWPKSHTISAEELLPGDLGFLRDAGGGFSHVLVFAGYDRDGTRMWVHSSGGEGVIFNSPSYESSLLLRRPSGITY